MHPSIHRYIHPSIYPAIQLSSYPFVRLSIYPSIDLFGKCMYIMYTHSICFSMAVLCSHSITFFKSQFDASQDCTTAAQQSFLIVSGSKLGRQIWNVLHFGPLKPRSFTIAVWEFSCASSAEGRKMMTVLSAYV